MTQVYEAIVENGVFRPITNITLQEGRRVRLIVESDDNPTVALDELDAYLATLPDNRAASGLGPLPDDAIEDVYREREDAQL